MSLIYVKHHDDQVATFNAKCLCPVLMNHIKTSLNLTSPHLDLIPHSADYKQIQPMTINTADKAEVYANSILAPRGVYVLLQVNEDEDGAKEWVSLWQGKGDETDKLTAALDARATDERKKGGKGKPPGKK
jgi:hypothetical protein